ncbi:MAG TPA: hypothetical protein P5205_18085 [Candidatus Paceibacterota bacterium]|nr:hypothetical protein [Verrucomicrobiota bacterium]HSA12273.1 hypothetical protein [Candidatus Paceibacterota bacterium]
MSSPNVIDQIRQYHGVVLNAYKTIADTGRQQIEAAYKCGQLLVKEKAHVRSGHWGRFCESCGISEDTAGRYIKLCKSADLRDLIQNYSTLNSAYQGEGITSPQRQRIRVITPAPATTNTAVSSPVAEVRNGRRTKQTIKADSAPVTGSGADGINLKTKVKGIGTLGDLLGIVPPAMRADIESQLRLAANGGTAQKSDESTIPPVENSRTKTDPRLIDPSELGVDEIAGAFRPTLLIDALLLQLKRCGETENPAEIDACLSSLRPVINWYEEYATKAEALVA